MVDPDREVIVVFRREGDSFGAPVELTRERADVLRTDLLPGLELPLARVFGGSDSPRVKSPVPS
jgi:hypothetical protein